MSELCCIFEFASTKHKHVLEYSRDECSTFLRFPSQFENCHCKKNENLRQKLTNIELKSYYNA